MAETLLEKAQRLGIKPAGQPVAQQPTTQTTSSGAIQGESLLEKAQRLGIKPANAPAAPVQTPTIPNVKETRKQKIERLKQEAAAAQEKSDKINSPFNQYVRPVADAVLPGVSSLGDTISGMVNTSLQGPELESQIQSLDNLQNSILRQIKDRHAKGKDATDLEQEYNSTSGLIDRLRAKFKESTKGADKTTGQVAGELGSTALDVLSAGTYSRVKGAAEATPSLITAGKEALQTTAPLLSKETGKQILKGVATAAPVAYGYDVAAGLQGERGQDRTSANAFIPGITTAVGATIGGALPALSAAENSLKKSLKAARTNTTKGLLLPDTELDYINDTVALKTTKLKDYLEKSAASGNKTSQEKLDTLLKANGTYEPKAAQDIIDNIAKDLNSTKEGSGDMFKSSIDPNDITPEELKLRAEDAISQFKNIDPQFIGFKLDNGKRVKDVAALEAIKKGFDPTDVAFIKNSNTEDRAIYKKALEVAQYGADNKAYPKQAIEETGKVVVGQAKTLLRAKQNIGNQLGLLRKEMADKPVNLSKTVTTFGQDLADAGINITDGNLDFSNSRYADIPSIQNIIKIAYDKLSAVGENGTVRGADMIRQQLGTQVDLSSNLGTMDKSAKRIIQRLYANLGDDLTTVSPKYSALNKDYSRLVGILDDFQKVLGKDFKITDSASNLKAGEIMRRMLGNASANPLRLADNIQVLARQYGYNKQVNVRNQMIFNQMLEDVFGPKQSQNLQSQVRKANISASDAGGVATDLMTGNSKGVLLKTAGIIGKKLNLGGKDPSKEQIEALRRLLQ